MIPLVSIVLLVAALFCRAKGLRIASIGLSLLVVLLAVSGTVQSFRPSSLGEQNLRDTRKLMAYGVAEAMAVRYSGKSIALLGLSAQPRKRASNGSEALQFALQESLRKKGFPVRCLAIEGTGGMSDIPGEEGEASELAVVDWESWNAALQSARERGDVLLLSLPLAPSLRPGELPETGEGPLTVLLYPPSWKNFHSRLHASSLDLVLMYRAFEGAATRREGERPTQEAFDRRFFFLKSDPKGVPSP